MATETSPVATELCIICGLPIGRRAYVYSTPGSYAHLSCSAVRDAQGHEIPQLRTDGRWT